MQSIAKSRKSLGRSLCIGEYNCSRVGLKSLNLVKIIVRQGVGDVCGETLDISPFNFEGEILCRVFKLPPYEARLDDIHHLIMRLLRLAFLARE